MEGPDKNRSFVNKPRYIQALVLFAGVAMNLIVAWILLSVSFMSGFPTSAGQAPKNVTLENQALTITTIIPSSPAYSAGLLPGDKIVSLSVGKDSTETPSAESVRYFVSRHSKDEITLSYIRNNENKTVKITPEITKDSNTPVIGIGMDIVGNLKLPVHKAILEGAVLTYDVTIATVKGFYKLIHDGITGKGDLSSVTGPIGIVGVVGDAAHFGFIYLLSLTALISVNLAVINLIPFPALDGGRLLFLLIEKIKGSRINPKVANTANIIGFSLLMIFMVLITYHDIVKLL